MFSLPGSGELLLWATAFSVLVLLATLVTVPWVVARLPADYFTRPTRSPWRNLGAEPWYALLLGLVKNLVGAVLLVLGVLMLFTPGQGLLTLLVGLLLMNFPGKYRLERLLVGRPGVLAALNWLRQRKGTEPFESPHAGTY